GEVIDRSDRTTERDARAAAGPRAGERSVEVESGAGIALPHPGDQLGHQRRGGRLEQEVEPVPTPADRARKPRRGYHLAEPCPAGRAPSLAHLARAVRVVELEQRGLLPHARGAEARGVVR